MDKPLPWYMGTNGTGAVGSSNRKHRITAKQRMGFYNKYNKH